MALPIRVLFWVVSFPRVFDAIHCSLLTCLARAIQDQLLKDFANRAEFSNWFGRDELPDDESKKPKKPVVLKPNPRNIEHEEKIAELEARIKRCVKYLQYTIPDLFLLLTLPQIKRGKEKVDVVGQTNT